jgi:hypothetical protein
MSSRFPLSQVYKGTEEKKGGRGEGIPDYLHIYVTYSSKKEHGSEEAENASHTIDSTLDQPPSLFCRIRRI